MPPHRAAFLFETPSELWIASKKDCHPERSEGSQNPTGTLIRPWNETAIRRTRRPANPPYAPASFGGRRYAAPCRYKPADGIACENTIRIGTKIAALPGVNGTATSTRDPSSY